MVKAFKANAEAHAALAQVAAASTMDEYISRDLCEHDSDEEDEDSQQNAEAMSFDSLTDLFNSANVDLDLVLLPEHQRCCSHTLNLGLLRMLRKLLMKPMVRLIRRYIER